MIIQTILTFFVFLCPLIFFHELGHFLFAKFFKVKVEVFSLGFGPKIFKKVWGETEYALSIIPLGGYVKMYGDDPFKPRNFEDPNFNRTYVSKKSWQKFLIVFAGPLANFLLAFALYTYLPLKGEQVAVFTIGEIESSSALSKAGFNSGDEILSIQGKVVRGFEDLAVLVGKSVGKLFSVNDTVGEIVVKRNNEEKTLDLNLSFLDFLGELSKTMPLMEPKLVNTKGEVFTLQFENDNNNYPYQAFEQKVALNAININLVNANKEITKTIVFKQGSWQQTLSKEGLMPQSLVVEEVMADSPAAKSGLAKGDILYALNKERLWNFTQMRDALQLTGSKIIELEVYRNATKQVFSIAPTEREIAGKKMFTVGVASSMNPLPAKQRIIKLDSWPALIQDGWDRMILNSKRTIVGMLSLFTLPNAMQMIGGPVTIAKAATDSLNISVDQFLRLMALISINLAILNLMPIPVLDGGHLIFITLEAIIRKPLHPKILEWSYKIGFSLIISLVVVALYNDLFRHL